MPRRPPEKPQAPLHHEPEDLTGHVETAENALERRRDRPAPARKPR